MKFLPVCLVFCLFMASCKKPETPVKPEPFPPVVLPPDTTGIVNIELTNVVNGSPLVLGTTTYSNANNDAFKVDIYNYYFTNVVLETASGYRWVQPESYFLVSQADPTSLKLKITGVPRANYTKIEFKVGVDGSRNTSGAQTGALDPANGMFWTWSSGYIMAKIEGTSPQSSDPTKKIIFHLGGFTGIYSSVRTFNFTFPNSANVTETHAPTVNIKNDLAEWFKTPNMISFSTTSYIMSTDANSKKMADNYMDMFNVTSVVN